MGSYIQWIIIHYYHYFVALIVLNLAIGNSLRLTPYFNIFFKEEKIYSYVCTSGYLMVI